MPKPSVYREAVAEEILAQPALGKSLASIWRNQRMPTYRTVISWLVRDFRGFAERYWAARRVQCIHLSEQIITIADQAVGAGMAGATVQSYGAMPGSGRLLGWITLVGASTSRTSTSRLLKKPFVRL